VLFRSRGPKYKITVDEMALLVRFLELLKPKAPKKDQLLLEDSQQLLLEDIKDDGSLSPGSVSSSPPPNNNGAQSPSSEPPSGNTTRKRTNNNNASSVNSDPPSNNNASSVNSKPSVKRNNTSKLRIKAPKNENISNLKKSERRTALRRTQPSQFNKPRTNLVHRTEAIGLSGSTGAKPSSNVYKQGKGSRKNR